MYSASIACRGYLLSHDKPPKIKGFGLKKIRGSTHKLVTNLGNELRENFGNVLTPKQSNESHINEHYVNENVLGLLRSFMCHPTSLYVDIFPIMANMKKQSIENEFCGIDDLCISLIKTSNRYSDKYESKSFNLSRFDYLQQSLSFKHSKFNERNADSDNDDEDIVDEIEEFD